MIRRYKTGNGRYPANGLEFTPTDLNIGGIIKKDPLHIIGPAVASQAHTKRQRNT